MKRSVVAAALLAVTATTALADVRLNVSGYWSTHFIEHSSNSQPMCMMRATWTAAGAATGRVLVKWSPGMGLFFHVTKSNWSFPPGIDVPLSVSFDNGTREAVGSTIKTDTGVSSMIEIAVRDDAASGVLDDFANANRLTITFKQGDEPPWVGNMTGSRTAAAWFRMCIAKIGATATSPVGPKATSPVGPKATSPVGPKPTRPVKHNDDGSI